jgi:hypothetical protein
VHFKLFAPMCAGSCGPLACTRSRSYVLACAALVHLRSRSCELAGSCSLTVVEGGAHLYLFSSLLSALSLAVALPSAPLSLTSALTAVLCADRSTGAQNVVHGVLLAGRSRG